MSKIDRMPTMHGLLNPPCVFCGYNGQGYWRDKNHETKCPFYNIGDETRQTVLIKAASEGRLLVLPEVDGSKNGIAEAALKAIKADEEKKEEENLRTAGLDLQQMFKKWDINKFEDWFKQSIHIPTEIKLALTEERLHNLNRRVKALEKRALH